MFARIAMLRALHHGALPAAPAPRKISADQMREDRGTGLLPMAVAWHCSGAGTEMNLVMSSGHSSDDERPVPYNERAAFREVVSLLMLAGAFGLFLAIGLFIVGSHVFEGFHIPAANRSSRCTMPASIAALPAGEQRQAH
jgi:hypothetical protein